MDIVAIIPARGGSKGIPNKNIINIAGKPLLSWSIESAQKSRLINKVVVSSDSEIIKRPKKYSGDATPSNLVVKHALDYLKKKEKYIPDIVVLLQPTSPLRTAEDIDNAINLFINEKVGAVISVTEGDNKSLKSFFMENGILRGVVNNEFPFICRQSLPKTYLSNGAIYVISEKEFQKNKKLFSKKTLGFFMEKERSVDLDTLEDISIIENLLNKSK